MRLTCALVLVGLFIGSCAIACLVVVYLIFRKYKNGCNFGAITRRWAAARGGYTSISRHSTNSSRQDLEESTDDDTSDREVVNGDQNGNTPNFRRARDKLFDTWSDIKCAANDIISRAKHEFNKHSTNTRVKSSMLQSHLNEPSDHEHVEMAADTENTIAVPKTERKMRAHSSATIANNQRRQAKRHQTPRRKKHGKSITQVNGTNTAINMTVGDGKLNDGSTPRKARPFSRGHTQDLDEHKSDHRCARLPTKRQRKRNQKNDTNAPKRVAVLERKLSDTRSPARDYSLLQSRTQGLYIDRGKERRCRKNSEEQCKIDAEWEMWSPAEWELSSSNENSDGL